jgi:sphingolipid 8-(E)-desaturase
MATATSTVEAKLARTVDRKQRILSRREIEGMIAEGRHVLIYDGRVLKTDFWLKFHPGGPVSIKHMVGRDATDEINAYVYLHSISANPFCFE